MLERGGCRPAGGDTKVTVSCLGAGHADVTRSTSASLPVRLLDLGRREYAETWKLQLDLVRARQADEIPDTLVLVEHPDVITLGRRVAPREPGRARRHPDLRDRARRRRHLPRPRAAGRLPHPAVAPHERDLHVYLRNLEETLLRAVGEFGIAGDRNPGWTGLWTTDRGDGAPRAKLASIGIAVKRWVTLHGFALNVATDLARFAAINPCGLDATVMGSMSRELGRRRRHRRGQARGPRHDGRGVRARALTARPGGAAGQRWLR